MQFVTYFIVKVHSAIIRVFYVKLYRFKLFPFRRERARVLRSDRTALRIALEIIAARNAVIVGKLLAFRQKLYSRDVVAPRAFVHIERDGVFYDFVKIEHAEFIEQFFVFPRRMPAIFQAQIRILARLSVLAVGDRHIHDVRADPRRVFRLGGVIYVQIQPEF